jgi:hypothetical protein
VIEAAIDAFPKSANVYDSASDAYVALDRRDDALRAAEKAMELLPHFTISRARVRLDPRSVAG